MVYYGTRRFYMEKFTVYQYNNVFYFKDFFEKLGFQLYNENDYKTLRDKKEPTYEITLKSSLCESKYSLNDILTNLYDHFFIDYGETGLVLDTDPYYGIAYEEATCIFSSKKERDSAYYQLEESLKKKIGILAGRLVNQQEFETDFETDSYLMGEVERRLQDDFQKQYILRKKHEKVMKIISKKDEK